MTLWTLPQTANYLLISVSTLRRLWKDEGLPVIRISARHARVDPEALHGWLDARTVAGWPEEGGQKAPYTSTATAGESPSASAPTRSASASAKSGNAARRRKRRRSSATSSHASVVAFRPRRAG